MKKELEQAARKALRELELHETSALAMALSQINMPKVRFKFSYKAIEFDCIATFDEMRTLFEVEIIHPKLSGRITFNKR